MFANHILCALPSNVFHTSPSFVCSHLLARNVFSRFPSKFELLATPGCWKAAYAAALLPQIEKNLQRTFRSYGSLSMCCVRLPAVVLLFALSRLAQCFPYISQQCVSNIFHVSEVSPNKITLFWFCQIN